MAVARLIEATAVDSFGEHVGLSWKLRRSDQNKPYRWELRRLLQTHFAGRKGFKPCKEISNLLPDFIALWKDVGVYDADSYWPSLRQSRLIDDCDSEKVSTQASCNTICTVLSFAPY
jgi:hypothetical protein